MLRLLERLRRWMKRQGDDESSRKRGRAVMIYEATGSYEMRFGMMQRRELHGHSVSHFRTHRSKERMLQWSRDALLCGE